MSISTFYSYIYIYLYKYLYSILIHISISTELNHIISEADQERFRQQREYDVVINERDIRGTQLIRRNDELALLYEKIKIQRAAISQGEIAYRERLEDLRVLRLRENGLRRELHIQRSQASALDGLRAEVYTLQRELLQDRTKVKALSEELENPDNTHRWCADGSRSQPQHTAAVLSCPLCSSEPQHTVAALNCPLCSSEPQHTVAALNCPLCSSEPQHTVAALSRCPASSPQPTPFTAALSLHVLAHVPCSCPLLTSLAHVPCSCPLLTSLAHVPCSCPLLTSRACDPLPPSCRRRKLEGSDPGTYEMVQKIQALQKRLIAKTEEVVEKDLLIQEKDKLYVELKNILARQPGPEVAEQLSIYQQGLRDKTKAMKAMASELNMYQAQVNHATRVSHTP